eukprot:TRINITY_DN62488_c0_g1_i1.p1 TRINITY_DN62488_c0_g1~~TRINITY_DN62488_c0_g1_i1.p1  ORF type:complete len:1063 (-),score=135.54 TRINITY_DN62488_c0_g1_i1:27-3137(-)
MAPRWPSWFSILLRSAVSWPSAVAVVDAEFEGNPLCWEKSFGYKTCCFPAPAGNPTCWDSVFTYALCCTADGVSPPESQQSPQSSGSEVATPTAAGAQVSVPESSCQPLAIFAGQWKVEYSNGFVANWSIDGDRVLGCGQGCAPRRLRCEESGNYARTYRVDNVYNNHAVEFVRVYCGETGRRLTVAHHNFDGSICCSATTTSGGEGTCDELATAAKAAAAATQKEFGDASSSVTEGGSLVDALTPSANLSTSLPAVAIPASETVATTAAASATAQVTKFIHCLRSFQAHANELLWLSGNLQAGDFGDPRPCQAQVLMPNLETHWLRLRVILDGPMPTHMTWRPHATMQHSNLFQIGICVPLICKLRQAEQVVTTHMPLVEQLRQTVPPERFMLITSYMRTQMASLDEIWAVATPGLRAVLVAYCALFTLATVASCRRAAINIVRGICQSQSLHVLSDGHDAVSCADAVAANEADCNSRKLGGSKSAQGGIDDSTARRDHHATATTRWSHWSRGCDRRGGRKTSRWGAVLDTISFQQTWHQVAGSTRRVRQLHEVSAPPVVSDSRVGSAASTSAPDTAKAVSSAHVTLIDAGRWALHFLLCLHHASGEPGQMRRPVGVLRSEAREAIHQVAVFVNPSFAYLSIFLFCRRANVGLDSIYCVCKQILFRFLQQVPVVLLMRVYFLVAVIVVPDTPLDGRVVAYDPEGRFSWRHNLDRQWPALAMLDWPFPRPCSVRSPMPTYSAWRSLIFERLLLTHAVVAILDFAWRGPGAKRGERGAALAALVAFLYAEGLLTWKQVTFGYFGPNYGGLVFKGMMFYFLMRCFCSGSFACQQLLSRQFFKRWLRSPIVAVLAPFHDGRLATAFTGVFLMFVAVMGVRAAWCPERGDVHVNGLPWRAAALQHGVHLAWAVGVLLLLTTAADAASVKSGRQPATHGAFTVLLRVGSQLSLAWAAADRGTSVLVYAATAGRHPIEATLLNVFIFALLRMAVNAAVGLLALLFVQGPVSAALRLLPFAPSARSHEIAEGSCGRGDAAVAG